MQNSHLVLTPEALSMLDAIARTGSFAAAARELGKVPSALTYNVRQLEDALDVLLFDRSSRQARFTAAGKELLNEGRRLLAEVQAVSNRVRRVATGWETQLAVAMDGVLSQLTLFELCEAFYALDPQAVAGGAAGGASGGAAGGAASGAAGRSTGGPGTRLRLRTEVLAGTWEALVTGEADLAIGVGTEAPPPPGVAIEPLGELTFVFAVAPHHPLAALGASDGPLADADLLPHRAVAVADSAHRLSKITVNLLPGQDVLTVATTHDKIEALVRGMGCAFVPEPMARHHIAAGRLVVRKVQRARQAVRLGYAWRCDVGPRGRRAQVGLALGWWLEQLKRPATRAALMERHVPCTD
ncbi:MAG: LysR family transcriptional regulator [Methylibium sp. NZG]|nr:MAG: LysR family transcriptional regulator [Methylibium sp. NZG]